MFHLYKQIRWMSNYASPLNKILIANRGEIACRIIRTARRLGVKTVAVYSNADKCSKHVLMADEAICLGSALPQESYLNSEKITVAAQRTGAEAIHPGYGFLSENAEFATLCEKLGIIFIGPPATAIRDMGIKSISKNIMATAGVPVILGYHDTDQSDSKLEAEAQKIGFPVMIKAVRGGGGKGMRIAMTKDEFSSQLHSARREAMKSFGNDDVLIEKFIPKPRHVEVQIFGDQHGNYVYLFERDCSVQRRHQKIIEEAPAPGIKEEERKSLGEAAVKAARAVNYVGAGTVEFIMDVDHKFYFMEMNTRLQVEHPVTEMITNLDLVEWQLQVASGKELPLKQHEIQLKGHSFEARIYAEDPENNFMPQAGPLHYISTPDASETVRVESGVSQGDDVTVHYDPMIAKLVVWGKDRTSALSKLHQCLSKFNVVGLPSNVPFLMKLASHKQFALGNVHTNFIPEHDHELLHVKTLTDHEICTGVLSTLLHESSDNLAAKRDPFYLLRGMLPNGYYEKTVQLSHNDKTFKVPVVYENEYFVMTIENKKYKVKGIKDEADPTKILGTIGDYTFNFRAVFNNDTMHIFTRDNSYKMNLVTPKSFSSSFEGLSQKGAVSPMPGVIEKIMVKVGDMVKAGDALVAMTAMKMEYVVKAHGEAQVESILCKVGDSVAKNVELVKMKKTASE